MSDLVILWREEADERRRCADLDGAMALREEIEGQHLPVVLRTLGYRIARATGDAAEGIAAARAWRGAA